MHMVGKFDNAFWYQSLVYASILRLKASRVTLRIITKAECFKAGIAVFGCVERNWLTVS